MLQSCKITRPFKFLSLFTRNVMGSLSGTQMDVQEHTQLDKYRFIQLWETLATDFNLEHCTRVFEELSSCYSEQNRHYHTDAHIVHCLTKLDEANRVETVAPHIEMAIWCHDVIYNAGDPENEKKSALWFRNHALGHFSESDINQIEELITITEHRETPENVNEQLMVDIDLSSFGMPTDQFEQDGERIRKEFTELTDDQFIESQMIFLKSLLDRPSLFSTPFFFQNYEAIARENISNLLSSYETTRAH